VIRWGFASDNGHQLDFGLLLGLTAVAWHGALHNEKASRKEFKAELVVESQKIELQNRETALQNILSLFCDCILTLDHDFTILEPISSLASTLATLLLYTDPKALQGKCFLDIMSSGKEACAAALRNLTSLPLRAEMLPISLKDSHGLNCRVHACYTCLQSSNGNYMYVVIALYDK